MSTRSRKETVKYYKYRLTDHFKTDCIFCNLGPGDEQFVEETKSFMIIKNIFAYSIWDNQDVEHHLMVVPKRHIDSINDLSRNEAVEFVDIVGSYESRGYNIWARAPQSIVKSVAHQHTHLIKPGQTNKSFIFYLKKPYLRVVR